MPLDPSRVAFFIPNGLKTFKEELFNRVAKHIQGLGGAVVRGDIDKLVAVANAGAVPIVGCTPELRPAVCSWIKNGQDWIYWDRGFFNRVFATWLPKAPLRELSSYRWHLNCFQLQQLRDVPDDRWKALGPPVAPWQRDGRHIVLAEPSPTYQRFHGIDGWTDRTLAALRQYTDRPIIQRDKQSKIPLSEAIKGAHALVTHGSNAANEVVIMGCPVFVDPSCAAALVGQTDLSKIETPVYPDRDQWLWSLAYSQYDESELVDGTLWRLIC